MRTLDDFLREKNKEPQKIVDPEAWLMATGHFQKLEYPNSEETKTLSGEDIMENYEKIEWKIPEDERDFVKALVTYVRAALIIDDFISEDDRDIWQQKEVYSHPEVNSLFEFNKLRGTLIGGVLGCVSVWESDFLEPNSKIMQEYWELYPQYKGSEKFVGGYDKMTIENKVAFTKKINNFAKKLYEIAIKHFTEEDKDSMKEEVEQF